MKNFCCGLMLFLFCCSLGAEERVLLEDNFSDADLKQRRALRGDWQINNGVASCVQDDELYKKYKDHGPIIFYDVNFQNANIEFSYHAAGAKTVVFTANGPDGHVFRIIFINNSLQVRAFPPGTEKKSVTVAREELPLPAESWIPVKVTLNDGQATVKVGSDFQKTFEDASFARSKTNISLGFAFGTAKFQDVKLTTAK